MEVPQKVFALRLVSATEEEQKSALQENPSYVDEYLAEELRQICYLSWYSDPDKTRRVVSALNLLRQMISDPAVQAIADWSAGIGEIVSGRMRSAIDHLNLSENRFLALKRPLDAAQTQVSKLYALAMLGLYDEAIDCGLRVREVFLEHGDTQAAGKIELNLGNIYQKRDQYEKAEEFLELAQKRFENTGEFSRLIQIDNSLANALSHQHKFSRAESIYQAALKRAEDADHQVLKAEIESNLAQLLLFQGRFDRALQLFESSRRRFAKMNMPHQSAIAERELADAYLELNLAPEATRIYEDVTRTFDELELKSDKARALVYFARASIETGNNHKAHRLLEEAKSLYKAEENIVGLGTIKLIEADLYLRENNYPKTLEQAGLAEGIFASAGLRGRELHCRWLRGEAYKRLKDGKNAEDILEATIADSVKFFLPQITLRCHTSLGQLAADRGNTEVAESNFKKAISIIEEMRSPLPAEDFRIAFLGDKLTPYMELIGLYLDQEGEEKAEQAFILAENARSRVLLERLDQDFSAPDIKESRQDLQGSIRLETLREEVNWLHSLMNRLALDSKPFDIAKSSRMQDQIRERENEILDITRKQNIFTSPDAFDRPQSVRLETLQKELGDENVLVEYIVIKDKVSAFVVTDKSVKVVRDLCSEKEIRNSLDQIDLQIGRLRLQFGESGNLGYESINRTRQVMNELYLKLIAPLENLTEGRGLIVIPQSALHYVPFPALFDGVSYLAEKREVVCSPSARIFLNCKAKKKDNYLNALFVGVMDHLTPKVSAEIESLSSIIPNSKILMNGEATRENLRLHSAHADIIHLACHGKFRPDNPLFSALHLSDGWFYVSDANLLDLNSSLVVLSACETGINSISVGDEILGLARGFFSAGAVSLVLSLWQIDDETTAEFMTSFYRELSLGNAASSALRLAQVEMMQRKPHPFFWAPFFLIGCS